MAKRGVAMKPEECPKLDVCPKIRIVLDKDLSLDELYADCVRNVCGVCNEDNKPISETG